MGFVPSSRAAGLLALRALALTLCVPLGALALAGACMLVALRQDVVILGWVGLFLALPGLLTLRWTRPRHRERPPGASIDRAAEPALWRLVLAESAALGLKPPDHVHVSLDHAVWIVRRARTRTLVVGAPLAFDVPERVLRVAVSVALLRDADRLGRALDGWACRVLERAHAGAVLPLSGPWRWIARRIWPQVAGARRARALLADARCSQRLGADAAAGWLRADARDAAFGTYWQDEVARCLEAGYRPPLLEGWQRFRRHPGVAEHVSTTIAAALQTVSAPGDPRPSLGERMAAVEAAAGPAAGLADGGPFVPDTPIAALEAAALGATGGAGGTLLVELDWERVADVVVLPQLHAEATAHRAALAGLTAGDLPRLAALAAANPGDGATLSLETLAAALAVALAGNGWELVADPPGPLRAVTDDHDIFVLQIPEYLAIAPDHEEWTRLVADADLRHLPLAAPEEPAEPGDELPANLAAPWPTLTVPSALALHRTPRLRRMTAAVLAIAGPIGIALCVLMAALAITTSNERQAVFFGIAAPLASIALVWWLGKRARIAFGRGSLSITSGELRIEDRSLLREPLVIDRAQIRAVAIDEGAAHCALGRPLRFPFGRSLWRHPSRPAMAASGWLWTGAHGSSVPLLGVGGEVPNLLLLFSEPLPGPPMRLRGVGLPRDGEPLAGLALRIGDTAAAQAAFAGWGVLRPLSEEDGRMELGPAFALERDRGVQRRAWRRGWILIACGLIVPPVALCAVWEAVRLRPVARLRAAALCVAAVTVAVVRSALYAGWI